MKNLRIRTTLLSLTATTLTLISPFTNKSPSYNPDYEINSCYVKGAVDVPFASCQSGNIYIIPESQAQEIDNFNKENSIFVIDERTCNDPNLQIYNSATITDENKMYEILTILQEYNELYPSNWNRTISSMLNEWEIHNICSSINYKPIHTDHVDLNNEDEEKYDSKVLTKILNN